MNNGTVASKSVAEVIEDLRDELKEFVSTRIEMLRSEVNEKISTLKMNAPVLAIGLVLLLTAWFVLTGFLVCIIAAAFAPNPWAWTVSSLIVGVLYAILGGAAAMMAWRRLTQKGITPERTIKVLKQDGLWLQAEGKTQL